MMAEWTMRVLGTRRLAKVGEKAYSLTMRTKSVCHEWRDPRESRAGRIENSTKSLICLLGIGALTVVVAVA